MKVYDITKTTELTEYDLELGYLQADKLIKHIDKVDAIPERGHYELINKSSLGASYKYVIDSPAVKAVEEHDSEEDILIYIPYTIEQLQQKSNQKELNELTEWFNTYFDMQVKQHSWQNDYSPSFDSYFNLTYNTWEDLCAKAQTVRERINYLRQELNNEELH